MSSLASGLSAVNWQLGAIVVGVMALVWALLGVLRSLRAPAEVVARIDRVVTREASGPARVADGGKQSAADLFGRLLRPLVALSIPNDAEELSRMRAQLVQAGLRSDRAMETFLISKLLLATVATLTFLQVNSHLAQGLQLPLLGCAVLLVCAVAFFAPNLWLSMRVSRRKTEIERALPDAMDLLVTCVEAGLGMDAALSRVADEMTLVAPLLAGELRVTFLETQAGIARREALRRLSERTGVDDLRELAAALAQTDIFGTSIARSLRIHSDSMRLRRMQNAERKASMVGVKMTIPLILCILPSLVAVVLGPAIVTIATNLMGL